MDTWRSDYLIRLVIVLQHVPRVLSSTKGKVQMPGKGIQ